MRLSLLTLLFLVQVVEARPTVAIDLLAQHSMVERRLSAPEPLASQVDKVHGVLRFRPKFSLGRRWLLETPVGIALTSGVDGGTMVIRTQHFIDLSYPVSRWRLSAGPGVIFHTYLASGGSVLLANGESTATFYLPSESTTSALFALYFGAEWFLWRRFSLGAHCYGSGVGSPRRRSLTLAVGIGAHF